MARITLRDRDNKRTEVNQDSSAVVDVLLCDTDSEEFAKASVLTLTATLINALDRSVINGREEQDIRDANGGTLSDEGLVRLRLQAADNPIVGDHVEPNATESHYLLIAWTWQDEYDEPQRSSEEYEILVRRVAEPVAEE